MDERISFLICFDLNCMAMDSVMRTRDAVRFLKLLFCFTWGRTLQADNIQKQYEAKCLVLEMESILMNLVPLYEISNLVKNGASITYSLSSMRKGTNIYYSFLGILLSLSVLNTLNVGFPALLLMTFWWPINRHLIIQQSLCVIVSLATIPNRKQRPL